MATDVLGRSAVRTAQRRLAHCRLGVSSFKQQKGRCDICHAYRHSGSRPVQTVYNEFKECVDKLCPKYFEKLQGSCADLDYTEDHAFWLRLRKYVQDHGEGKLAPLRMDKDKNQLDEIQSAVLGIAEATLLYESTGFLENLRLMNFHLSLTNTLDSEFREDWNFPKPYRTNIL